MTYSIVARDPQTGQLGVAVQTFNLAVGTWVPWAAGGVGAVATQALAERSYGTRGLELIREGKSAPEALQTLLAADPQREQRQVSMIDAQGRIGTHTGRCCIPEAGSHLGDTFCTQANMMLRDTVWQAMAEAYQAAQGDLADRLMAALDAAQAEGGDMRGKQTAALLVVDRAESSIPLIDLRVDRDPQPLKRLRHMLRLHRAYTLEYQIADHVRSGDTQPVYGIIQKIVELAPEESYLHCLCALHLDRVLGRRQEALDILRPLVARQPQWRRYLQREYLVAQRDGCTELGEGLLAELDALSG
jgi:uncharacterized Ntn-hydrolase superfamily protein